MSRLLSILALSAVVVSFPVAAGAQTGTLFVEGDNVGIGTDAPATTLHVMKADGTAKVQVQETSGTTQVREMFKLINNGGPFFVFADTSTSKSYSFAMSGAGDFIISHQQTPGVQLRLSPTGNMTITGTLTQGSSRAIKDGIVAVDRKAVLEKVVALPVATWHYRTDAEGVQHLGPMAEDFYGAFGLGATDKGISAIDSSGVALAAIQGLYEVVEQQRAQIEELRSRLAEIELGEGAR